MYVSIAIDTINHPYSGIYGFEVLFSTTKPHQNHKVTMEQTLNANPLINASTTNNVPSVISSQLSNTDDGRTKSFEGLFCIWIVAKPQI